MKPSLEQEQTSARVLPAMEAHALWAKTYDDGSNPLLALEERAMEPLLPELKGKRVLDVACGTGRWMMRLCLRGADHLVGVDLSREMLHAASAKPALAGALVRSDCLALPLRGSSIHLTLCSFAVSYLAELAEFANELARVSKPFARVLISDFHPDGLRRGWKRSFRCGGQAIEIANFAYSVGAICHAFEKAGFVLLRKVEPHIDDPERPIFVRAWKLSQFDSIKGLPAIFILDFQFVGRCGDPSETR